MPIINFTYVYDKEKIAAGDTLPEALGIPVDDIVKAHHLITCRRDDFIKAEKAKPGYDGTCVFNALTNFFDAYEDGEITSIDLMIYAIDGYSMVEKMKHIKAKGFGDGFDAGLIAAGLPKELRTMLKDLSISRMTGNATMTANRDGSPDLQSLMRGLMKAGMLDDDNEEGDDE